MRLWMVFIAAGVFACADGRPGSGNTPPAALLKASQDADHVPCWPTVPSKIFPFL